MKVGTFAVGNVGTLLVLVASAVLEVLGDAVIRKGLRGGGFAIALLGMAVLAIYGALVNLLDMRFSEMLGAYVGIFAVVSLVVGVVIFREGVSTSTWVGLAFILGGSIIIQVGRGG
jgi:drug/metabolite transporter superfamily protein YnfA